MTGNLSSLLKLFKSDRWEDRKNAYELIKDKVNDRLVKALIAELAKEDHEDFNYWVLKIISSQKNLNSANRKLIYAIVNNHLGKKNYSTLKYFIPFLVLSGDEIAIYYLVEMFKAPTWGIRNEVSENLIKLGPQVAPHLLKAFQNSTNKDVQYWAMKVYGKVMGSQSLEKLGTAYKSNNYLIRYYSIIALGETESDKAIPILVKSLDDESFIIRTRSSEILESMGEKILPFLEVFFKKGTSNMKIAAIRLFARIKGEDGISEIKELTKDLPDRSFYLISALAEVKTFDSINLLIELLVDPSWEVRKYTYDQLIRFGSYTIRVLKNYIAENPYIDHELYVWFAKIFSNFPVEASSEIVFLLRMNNDDILNAVLENIRKDRITKDVVYEIATYFSHEKWPLRKKVAMFLRSCGKMVIPFLREYLSETENSDEKYWTSRTLLYLGDTSEHPIDGSDRKDVFLEELAQEVAAVNQDIIDKMVHEPAVKVDRKELILGKISGVENLYLRNILIDIVNDSDARRQGNQILLMKDYISKNDFSILLDLYEYLEGISLKEALIEVMKPIFSNDYVDIFIYLFNAEQDPDLRIVILNLMKHSASNAIVRLAEKLVIDPDEKISSIAQYILDLDQKRREETQKIEEPDGKPKPLEDQEVTEEIQTPAVTPATPRMIKSESTIAKHFKAEHEKQKVVRKTPVWMKAAVFLLLLAVAAETFLLFNYEKYINPPAVVNASLAMELKQEKQKTEKLLGEEKNAQKEVEKKLATLKKILNAKEKLIAVEKAKAEEIKSEASKKIILVKELKEKETELKKLIAKRDDQIKANLLAMNDAKNVDKPVAEVQNKTAGQASPDKKGTEGAVGQAEVTTKTDVKVAATDIKQVSVENAPAGTETGTAAAVGAKPQNPDKKQDVMQKVKEFYVKYNEFYNTKKVSEIKGMYSSNYDDGEIKGTSILTKVESEITLLGKAKLNLNVLDVKESENNLLVRYVAFISGELKTGLTLTREMTETTVQDVLVCEKGDYKIICTKDIQ